MKIAGIHSGHDSAFCILDNGKPIIHAELERYTREKEPKGDSLKFLFDVYDKFDDIKYFAHCLHPSHGGIKTEFPESFDKMMEIANKNGGEFHVVDHHLSHAAHAFYSSNFKNSLIVTIDGGGPTTDQKGNITTTTFGVFIGVDKKLKLIGFLPYELLDVGGFWTYCTKEIFGLSGGYPKGHQAGTVMAMAALGNPEKWKQYFKETKLRPISFIHSTQRKNYYDAVMALKRGEKFDYWGTLPLSEVLKHKELIENSIDFPNLRKLAEESEQNKFDIAAGIQAATEEILREIIENAITTYDTSGNLCIAGGVALNSVMTGKFLDWFSDKIKNIYIPPIPYDAGLAIGNAQYVWHHILENDRIEWQDNFTPYLGEKYSEDDVLNSILDYENISYRKASLSEITDLLLDQKIISVFGGGSESGRRALGNRSILADPRSESMKDLINAKVKHRQWFRPFAPSILRSDVKDWFVKDICSPYMSFVIHFRDEVKDKVPAVVHFDGTARLQTVSEKDNKWYFDLLTLWKQKSGVPILLNTSFNDREPIVEKPKHAIDCFLGTEIDYLYFFEYNVLVYKKD
jgi:carbamoyltransferase